MSTGASWTSNSPAAFRTCSCSTLFPLLLFPALAEALGRVVHVLAHGRARRTCVVARDGADDLAVLLDGGAPQLGRVEVVLQAQEERAGALVPERLHHQRERAVAARFGDAQVEELVRGKRHHA